MRNFQDVIFIQTRTYREIFKSTLVYLQYFVLCVLDGSTKWLCSLNERQNEWKFFLN